MLSSIVLASLNTARAKARDAQRSATIKNLKTALELYFDDNGHYSIEPDIDTSTDASFIASMSPYIPKVVDPLNNASTGYVYPYYTNNSLTVAQDSYGIRVRLENGGYCKTGVKVSSGWWGVLPACNF